MLTPEQSLYLAQRLCYSTPKEAAEAAGVTLAQVAEWENDFEFKAHESNAFEDHLAYAKERSKVLLGKAMSRLDAALDARKNAGKDPDYLAQLKATELLAKMTGLMDQKKQREDKADQNRVIVDF